MELIGHVKKFWYKTHLGINSAAQSRTILAVPPYEVTFFSKSKKFKILLSYQPVLHIFYWQNFFQKFHKKWTLLSNFFLKIENIQNFIMITAYVAHFLLAKFFSKIS